MRQAGELTSAVEDVFSANKEGSFVSGGQLEGVGTGQRDPQLAVVPTSPDRSCQLVVMHGVNLCHDDKNHDCCNSGSACPACIGYFAGCSRLGV